MSNSRISVDFSELKQFKKNLKAFKRSVPSINTKIMDNCARKLVYIASEETPIMWGNLKDHWSYKLKSGRTVTTAYIINDLPYASFVEEGHKQSRRFLPGKFVSTPGGTKFQYMPWVRGEGIMLHAGWVPGAWMYKRALMQFEMGREIIIYGEKEFKFAWQSIMGV